MKTNNKEVEGSNSGFLPKSVFEYVLGLPEEQQVVVILKSQQEANSWRAAFSRLAATYSKKTGEYNPVRVRQKKDKETGEFRLFVYKQAVPKLVLADMNGNILQSLNCTLSTEPGGAATLEGVPEDPESLRIVKLMRQDGYTDEQIMAHFKEERG